MKQRTRWISIGSLAIVFTAVAFRIPVVAKPTFVVKAKDLGYPAQNCTYCHTVKVPKKATAQQDLNDRGKWLLQRKNELKVPEVLLDWLKDYPGGKEQK